MFKIALAKTTMMCNLATEPFEAKRKNRARGFWFYAFTGSLKRLQERERQRQRETETERELT